MNNNENLCMFIQKSTSINELQILHFVYETKKQVYESFKTLAHFRLHAVIEGEGVLHTHKGDFNLSVGDIFFCLPACPYAIESVKNFKFAYVGYLGAQANLLAENFKLSAANCVFKGSKSVVDVFKAAISMPNEVSDYTSKSALFFALATIASTTLTIDANKKERNTASVIKKYIDDNFSNPDLSLESMCKSLSYNPKYISAVFKNEFKITFKEYLTTIRIQNACALIERGFTGVKNIARLSGFSDPLYFSKVFKRKMKMTPTEHLLEITNQRN